jgi:hypothetical protein
MAGGGKTPALAGGKIPVLLQCRTKGRHRIATTAMPPSDHKTAGGNLCRGIQMRAAEGREQEPRTGKAT